MTVPQGASRDTPERVRAYDGVAVAAAKGSPAVDLAPGLVSLKFIRTALRRRAWLWSAIAAAGLLIGLGMYVALPPAYQASTTILLTQMPGGSTAPLPIGKPPDAMQDDIVMMQSGTVAERAMRDLGLRQSVGSFIAAETVLPITDRVLTLTVSAPSSDQAVRRASALAAEFLKFRAEQLQAQQNLMLISLSQQISQAQQHAASLSSKIASVSAQPRSPARQAKLNNLGAQQRQAASVLTGLQQAIPNYQVTKTSAVVASGVLDPAAPIARMPGPLGKGVRIPIRYAVTGLIPGLTLGLGLAIVLELASYTLRRREDVAPALGVPVRLSVARLPEGGWRPGGRGLAAARGDDMQRVVAHLRDNVPGSSRGAAAALAVVAVDNAEVAALPLVSLAVSCAQEGRQVVVADLSGGHAARLLGAADPGVRAVSVDGADLVVAVPGHGDVVPGRPGAPRLGGAGPAGAGQGGAGRRLCLGGPSADPGDPGPLARRGASRDLGGRCRRGGDRRAVVVGEAARRGRDGTAVRDAPGLRRAHRRGQHRREPRHAPGTQPAPRRTRPGEQQRQEPPHAAGIQPTDFGRPGSPSSRQSGARTSLQDVTTEPRAAPEGAGERA